MLQYLLECATLNAFIVEGEFDERQRVVRGEII